MASLRGAPISEHLKILTYLDKMGLSENSGEKPTLFIIFQGICMYIYIAFFQTPPNLPYIGWQASVFQCKVSSLRMIIQTNQWMLLTEAIDVSPNWSILKPFPRKKMLNDYGALGNSHINRSENGRWDTSKRQFQKGKCLCPINYMGFLQNLQTHPYLLQVPWHLPHHIRLPNGHCDPEIACVVCLVHRPSPGNVTRWCTGPYDRAVKPHVPWSSYIPDMVNIQKTMENHHF